MTEVKPKLDKRTRWEERSTDEKLNMLRDNTASLKKGAAVLSRTSIRHGMRLDNLEPKKVTRFLEETKEDIIAVHSAYKLLILKQTVATELCWVEGFKDKPNSFDIMKTVIRAFDQPDAWWFERREITLGDWVFEMEKFAEQLAQLAKEKRENGK